MPFAATDSLPIGAPLLPGDLLFYGTPTHVTHVGIYVGCSRMIDASHRGAVVRIEDYRWVDYVGATRPAQTLSTSVRALPVPNR